MSDKKKRYKDYTKNVNKNVIYKPRIAKKKKTNHHNWGKKIIIKLLIIKQ